MSVLVLLEFQDSTIQQSSRSAVTAAAKLGPVHVLLVGKDLSGVSAAAAKLSGVTKVLLAEDAAYEHALAEPVASLLVGLAPEYSHILVAATAFGKNIIPRAAALLDVQPISDISGVVDQNTFVRPIYAGNALATVLSTDTKKLISVRGANFEPIADHGGKAEIAQLGNASVQGLSRFVSAALTKSERPELTAARIVVSGGRGLGSAENFALLNPLADQLGAAIGAGRAAVDSGFIPNDHQVGQTGKIVAPDLYIAIGISGAIQHLAGMKDSKVIVAVNKDEEAPIFQIADYGYVGDLFKAVPELVETLQAKS
jgi:electron transfer flavoprotein alpha subunit